MAPHQCSTLVLTCIDFRFQASLHQWFQEQNLIGDFDRVSVAGGVLNLNQPKEATYPYRGLILNQLTVAHNLHHIKRVILINHEDCGAYGGKSAFDSDESEKAHHTEQLNQARSLILNKFPNLMVEVYFAKLNGQMETV